jgi:hypothetical protein
MFMNDAVMAPWSAAERELLAELTGNARCTCGGKDRPAVHDFPPCVTRLIKRLQVEIVSLQVLADEALTAANAQSAHSRHDGGPREHAEWLLREYLRAAFVGAGLAWRDTHNVGVGVLVDCLVEAVRVEDIELRRGGR